MPLFLFSSKNVTWYEQMYLWRNRRCISFRLFGSGNSIGPQPLPSQLTYYSDILSFGWQVLDLINNPHYLYRMTILHAVSLLAPVMGSEITCSQILPIVINSSKDRWISCSCKFNLFDLFAITWIEQRVACHRVPNIKFNVAKVLQSLIPIVDQSVSTIADLFLCCFWKHHCSSFQKI